MIKNYLNPLYLLPLLLPLNLIGQSFDSPDWISFEKYSSQKEYLSWDILKDDGNKSNAKFETEKTLGDWHFKVKWIPKMYTSPNGMELGGVSSLDIYYKNKHIQTLRNLKDKINAGMFVFTFTDYNFDGHIDISILDDCAKSCYEIFYIFNPQTQQFEHHKDWDYLEIAKVNPSKKQILSVISGTAFWGTEDLYQVEGLNLKRIKVIEHNSQGK